MNRPLASQMKLHHIYGVLLALLTIQIFSGIVLPIHATEQIANYTALHTLLEIIAIIISMLVFAVGWIICNKERSGNFVLLACFFLGVAIFDVLHTLSYPGMPDPATANDPEKAINFWLAARTFASMGLLVMVLPPLRFPQSESSRWLLLASALILIGLVSWIELWHPDWVPPTFDDQDGLTNFKKQCEYVLIVLYGATALSYLKRAETRGPYDMAGLFGAASVMALSEVFFTLYASVADVFNLLGHIYKVIAYAFIYHSIFVASIRAPYQRLLESKEALHASEQRWKFALEGAGDGLWEWDIKTDNVIFSKRWKEMLGYAEDEIANRFDEWEKRIHPEDKRQMAETSQYYLQGKSPIYINEFRLRCKDGSYKWILARGMSISRNEEGTPLRVIGTHSDITARKKTELELKRSEAKFRSIINHSPVPFALNDDRQNITFLNPAFIRLFGYTHEDIPNLAAWWPKAYPDPVYREWVAETWQNHLKKAKTSGNDFEPLQLNIQCKDGTFRTVMAGAASLGDTFSGTHLVILHDISEQIDTMKKLADSRNMLQTVIDTIPVRVFWKNRQSRYLGCNQAFSSDAGLANPQQIIGKADSQLQWRENAARYRADDLQVMDSKIPKLGFEEPLTTREEKQIWVRTSKLPLVNFDDETIGVLGIYEDITAQKHAQEEMQLASLVYQNSSEAMMVTDADNVIITVNPAFTKVTGYRLDEVAGKTPRILQSNYHDRSFYRSMWDDIVRTGQWQGEIWNRRKNGEIYAQWLAIDSIFHEDGSVHRRVALIADITEKKKNEELIWRQANFDVLTGLPNRSMFYDRLKQEIKKSFRDGLSLAVLFIDLDRFKDINDTLGHGVGDILLREAARRLCLCVRETDCVARLGGDEFTVILTDLLTANDVDRIAQTILRKFSEPFQLEDEIAYLSASIGISLYPEDTDDIDILIKNADQAMYAAKNQGRDRYNYFTPIMQQAAQNRMRLANDMRSALAENQFTVHYQPIVELATGSIQKAEALLRWRHPIRDWVSPAEFIPIAEETRMIVEIGDWVFGEAVQQVQKWRKRYHHDFQISINKSPAQFRNLEASRTGWLEQLKKRGLPGQSILVEITEGLLLDASSAITDQLLAFRDMGVQVSLDDFGTGYSSLAYLKRFDIDYLKIDQTFVRNLTADSEDLALCEAITVMAHKLGIQVVAEGIETEAQRALLIKAGCDYGQGYLFSKPLPAEEFERLFSKSDCHSSIV